MSVTLNEVVNNTNDPISLTDVKTQETEQHQASDHTCTLCKETNERFEITGTRLIEAKEKIYKLCSTCCRQLRLLSTYKPSDVKKRRQFWESVWETLG